MPVSPAPDGLVFVAEKGARLRRSDFTKVWAKVVTEAGIPRIHIHDLRHTGNTPAAMTGASLKELMARMGHSSTKAVMVYPHVAKDGGGHRRRPRGDRQGRAQARRRRASRRGKDQLIWRGTGTRGGNDPGNNQGPDREIIPDLGFLAWSGWRESNPRCQLGKRPLALVG
ncbi:tyrosine-type recombinase/integrase [Streptosporangium sp. NPDC004631]